MKFFTIIVFKLQICFKCVSFSSLYSTSTKKRQGDCQNFSRRILFLDTRIFFTSFNQRPQIMEFLLSWIYVTLNILNSRATSTELILSPEQHQCITFTPPPLPMLFIANVSMPSCTPTLRGRGGGGGGGAVSCVPINVSVWGRSSDLVIMFSSWTRHSAITVTLFYGLFNDSFISPVFFLYIVQITKHRDSN